MADKLRVIMWDKGGCFMKRNMMKKLLEWKNKKNQSPLILLGARQVGKTYLLEAFAKNNYETFVYINFENEPSQKHMFEYDLNPKRIIGEIELSIAQKINPENTLIFFDEIQQAPKAITSLKYFKEQLPQYNIVCAGSLLGVMLLRESVSFPVGKVEFEYLYPFSFDEFLIGIDCQMLKEKIEACYMKGEQMPSMIHERLMDYYKRFLCIGGMPAAINNYKENGEDLLLFDQSIHENIINAYIADMGKYSKNSETIKVQAIYKSMPGQLARENRKFKYSTVQKGAKASQFESSIEWLLSSRLNLMCQCLKYIDFPLSAYQEERIFKLYMSDVGLLNKLGRIPYAVIMGNEHHLFKGAITENYVAVELYTNKFELYYYRRKAIEVDFILQIDGAIIPVEVKANSHTRSRSLNGYIERYAPDYAMRISANNFGWANNIKSVPLYAVFCIKNSK